MIRNCVLASFPQCGVGVFPHVQGEHRIFGIQSETLLPKVSFTVAGLQKAKKETVYFYGGKADRIQPETEF